jgi:xanthine dehydrogenase small subunit
MREGARAPAADTMRAGTVASPLEFILNGRRAAIEESSSPVSLLDYLRAHGLTGAKEGCAEGECGACAVAVVMAEGAGSAYRVVNSCLLPLPTIAGREIVTVEGLAADGRLADAQSAMAAAGGSQCGYCTPGFVMSLFAEQYRPDRSGLCDPLALAGNLCRCTGYRPIRDAALSLGRPPAGLLLDRLARSTAPLLEVQGEHFTRPASVDACLAILAADPEATIVAGASDLGVEANLRGRHFPRLVSVEAIDEMKAFSDTPDGVRIGAALPLADIGRRWQRAPAAVVEWLELFASPLIRNRATLGGNLATASPIGDAAPLLAALDASVEIASVGRRRRLVSVGTFFTAYRRTVMARGEILTAIQIPKPLPTLLRFYKVTKRRLDDISTVAAGMSMDWDGGRVRRARFAFGGVAATPIRALEAEAAVTGSGWTEAAVERAQAALDRSLAPMSDHRGSSVYRLEVSKSLLERFWTERPS